MDWTSGPDSAPALLKLGSVGFGEVIFGVTLHMDDAELNVGLREKAFGNRQQPREVVLNDDQHTT